MSSIYLHNSHLQQTKQRVDCRISAMNSLTWQEVAAGVWKAEVGSRSLAPLDYAPEPKYDSLEQMGRAAFPFDTQEIRAQRYRARSSVRIPLAESEQIYGLGLEFHGLDRRGDVYRLKVDHYRGLKGANQAPVPFYVSSAGYGVLINSAARLSFHVGLGNRKDSKLPTRYDRTTEDQHWQVRPDSDAVEVGVEGRGFDIYIFAGSEPLEAVRRYNLFCGGGVLPPWWGLGFWHRMPTESSAEDVQKTIDEYRKHDFPLDVIGLEPGWQSHAYPCSFDWDKGRFPRPQEFVQSLADQGIKVNLWENLYVSPESSLYEAISEHTCSHTVWLGEVPDLTLDEAREAIIEHHTENHLSLGVSGYKFDEVDGLDCWLWPDHATFPSGNDAVEMRQIYGLILQQMISEQFRAMNRRTYGLVRASNAGASSQGFVLYNDYYNHRDYVTALVNSSFCGVLWGPEVRDAESAEEWLRRFQTVCFSPMLQLDAWFTGKLPWSYPEVTDQIRQVVKLRMQLVPYFYTAFADYNRQGIPPIRAMVLEPGYTHEEKTVAVRLHDELNPYAESGVLESTDQYMLGPSMLVAPAFTGQRSRQVILPKGDWFDFYTGKYVGNGETIMVDAPLERIPLFVKDGGIVPLEVEQGNLVVRHYGNSPGSYELYDDDGETFDYEDGKYATLLLEAKCKNGQLVGTVTPGHDGWTVRYEQMSWAFMS